MDTIEANITRALVRHLAGFGFNPSHIIDDEADGAENKVADAEDIIRYTHEVDLWIFTVVFHRPGVLRQFKLSLIPGNGDDLLSDWIVPTGDAHGWSDALESFDPENMGLWYDDRIQFARLLCEIVANWEWVDTSEVAASMDVDRWLVRELLERAHGVWEEAKRGIN